jgi:predicted HTH domain antitoxin
MGEVGFADEIFDLKIAKTNVVPYAFWRSIMQIAIDLPNDFVAFQAVPDIRQEVRTSYALWLYQQERVTLVKAAELAGVNLYDFMSICKTNRVPVIDITRDELLEELIGFNPT